MKKQIDIFNVCEQCKQIASRFFNVHSAYIAFKLKSDGSREIEIFVHIIEQNGKMNGFRAQIESLEIKFGSDLIYNRVEKASIALAIQLGIYSPQVPVF